MSEGRQTTQNLDESIDSIEEYKFEPIKGFPLLKWRGKRPYAATQYYPAQLKEQYFSTIHEWRNKIYWGDNLQVMSHLLKQYRGKVKLVYIDPPFDSKADYKKKINILGKSSISDMNAFEEKQYTDIWSNDDYMQFMYERLILIKEILCDDGSLYLHCDWHKVHFLRLIIEEIFGPDNFQSEIIWKRTSARSDARTYGVSHDTILFFTKSSNFEFFPQYTKYDEDYLKRFNHEDSKGRFLDRDLSAKGLSGGGYEYSWKGVSGIWRCPIETMQRYEEEQRIYYTSNGTPRYKQYLHEMPGKKVQDIWDDIYVINSQSHERLDYPTQKPEALVARIIRSSSQPGDIVFDCFMGSGTTQAVAMKLGRRFIGADINLGAVQITTKRLLGVAKEIEEKQQKKQGELFAEGSDEPEIYYTGFEVFNVNHYDVFRNPVEARELLLEALEVNKLPQGHLFDGEKDGRMVRLMPVNRIATRADLNPLISGFDYKSFEKRAAANPGQPVEKITLVCMGHEPDLKATLEREANPYKLDVTVVDILRDKQDLQFKRDSEAKIEVKGGKLVIERFYPMNLLGKLSLQKEKVEDWRELVESVMIDWNYDGAVLQPATVDIPGENELVSGTYEVPKDAGTIRVKITDLLSESLEVDVAHG